MSVTLSDALPRTSSAWNYSFSASALPPASSTLGQDDSGAPLSLPPKRVASSDIACNVRARLEARQRSGRSDPRKYLIVPLTLTLAANTAPSVAAEPALSPQPLSSSTSLFSGDASLLDLSAPAPPQSSFSSSQTMSLSTAGSNAFLIDLFAPLAAPPSVASQTATTAPPLTSVSQQEPFAAPPLPSAVRPPLTERNGILELFQDSSRVALKETERQRERETESDAYTLSLRENIHVSQRGLTTSSRSSLSHCAVSLRCSPHNALSQPPRDKDNETLSLSLSVPPQSAFSASPSLSTRAFPGAVFAFSLSPPQLRNDALDLGSFEITPSPGLDVFCVMRRVQVSASQPTLARVAVRLSLAEPTLRHTTRVHNLSIDVALQTLRETAACEVTHVLPAHNARIQRDVVAWRYEDLDFGNIANKLDLEVFVRLSSPAGESVTRALSALAVPVTVRGECVGVSLCGAQCSVVSATRITSAGESVRERVGVERASVFECVFE